DTTPLPQKHEYFVDSCQSPVCRQHHVPAKVAELRIDVVQWGNVGGVEGDLAGTQLAQFVENLLGIKATPVNLGFGAKPDQEGGLSSGIGHHVGTVRRKACFPH